MPGGWLAIDLDGTLAKGGGAYQPGVIGEPVPLMAKRVRTWIAQGRTVVIFTARVGGEDAAKNEAARTLVERWTQQHFGQALMVTAVKSPKMVAFIDDRALSVETNTGRFLGQSEAMRQLGGEL